MAEPTFSMPMKSLQGSADKTCVGLLGTMKHGKTVAALSLSEKFDPTFSKPQTLDDLLVITCEPDALKGPKLMGVELPPGHWLDLTDYTDQGQKVFDQALSYALRKAKELATAGKIKGVIFDTVSTLDKTWKVYLSRQYEKWALIDALLVKHRAFLVEQILPLPVPSVLLFHTRKAGEMDAQKRESLGLDAGDHLLMDITGWDAPALYRAQLSYIVPIKKTEAKGKPDAFNLYPRGVAGMEAGGRYGLGGAPEVMPADLREFMKLIAKPAQKAA